MHTAAKTEKGAGLNLKNGLFHGRPTYWIASLLLLAVLVLSLFWAVTIGSVDLKISDVYRVILYKLFGIGNPEVYGKGSMSDIVWFVRLPRLVLAIGVGSALSISGAVMQAVVKNPLADPYVLGRTVIAAVHDLNIAAMYCDRLYAVKDGRIVGEGSPTELLTPEFIREVYEVEAEVFTDRRGLLRVIYSPARKGDES